MLRSGIAHIRRNAVLQDGRFLILMVTALGAFQYRCHRVRTRRLKPQRPRLILATMTIARSWAAVRTAFSLHYAQEYDRGDNRAVCSFRMATSIR